MNRTQLLLTKLAEEASEVAQIALKTVQFGMNDIGPRLIRTNKERIHSELNDLMAIIDMLNEESDLCYTKDQFLVDEKKESVNFYAEYSEELGLITLNDNERI